MSAIIPKIVVVGDPHASPKYDNNRFKVLGKFIKEERPSHIVLMGDVADMPSLSSYDRGKLSYEGRRYSEDCDAVHDALSTLGAYLPSPKRNLRIKHKPTLGDSKRLSGSLDNGSSGLGRVGSFSRGAWTSLEKYITYGNHEYRIPRLVNDNPELAGKCKLEDLRYEDFGWQTVGYRSTLELGGITFSHDFPSGISGRTIGGEAMAKALCVKNVASSVCGHSHIFDHHERTAITGRKIFGLSAGCFTHPGMIEDWNIQTHHLWWRGVVVLEGVSDGYYEAIRAITLKQLEKDYA